MVELAGIPVLENENPIKSVTKVAKLAMMTHYDENQVDVAHRLRKTNENPNPAIIVMFRDRASR